jgi:hypothetical protein
MSSPYDPTDFVDSELESARTSPVSNGTGLATAPAGFNRPPSREEIDSKMSEAQVKLGELKRAQEELERERAALEETRRRQIEFQTSREEMLQALTRGLGLLEKAEFDARRDAEQMSKATTDLKEALRGIQMIHEETWSKENYSTELTRALTTIENARLEWNGARLKFSVLSNAPAKQEIAAQKNAAAGASLAELTWSQLWKIGLAFTWPLIVLGAAIFALLLKYK